MTTMTETLFTIVNASPITSITNIS
jgi:hypothetical protein